MAHQNGEDEAQPSFLVAGTSTLDGTRAWMSGPSAILPEDYFRQVAAQAQQPPIDQVVVEAQVVEAQIEAQAQQPPIDQVVVEAQVEVAKEAQQPPIDQVVVEAHVVEAQVEVAKEAQQPPIDQVVKTDKETTDSTSLGESTSTSKSEHTDSKKISEVKSNEKKTVNSLYTTDIPQTEDTVTGEKIADIDNNLTDSQFCATIASEVVKTDKETTDSTSVGESTSASKSEHTDRKKISEVKSIEKKTVNSLYTTDIPQTEDTVTGEKIADIDNNLTDSQFCATIASEVVKTDKETTDSTSVGESTSASKSEHTDRKKISEVKSVEKKTVNSLYTTDIPQTEDTVTGEKIADIDNNLTDSQFCATIASEVPEQTITKVNQLRPDSCDVTLTVKVVSCKIVFKKGRKGGPRANMQQSDCLVGDETAVIWFTAVNDQVDLVKEDVTVTLKNARVEMFKGGLPRLIVDGRGRVEVSTPADFTVNTDEMPNFPEWQSSKSEA